MDADTGCLSVSSCRSTGSGPGVLIKPRSSTRKGAERSAPFYDAFAQLAEAPGIGHSRSDLTSLPVFFWTVRDRYAVVYRKSQPLEIVRVLSWKRDVEALLIRQ